jgi:hypothetical protein
MKDIKSWELTPENERQNAKKASARAFSLMGSGAKTGKYVTADS